VRDADDRLAAALAASLGLQLPDVDDPVTFRTLHRSGGHASLKLSDGTVIQFKRNVFTTRDADLIDALRHGPKAEHVIEVPA